MKPKAFCAACGKDFSADAFFDMHRIGKHEYTLWEGLNMDPPKEDGRRCLTPEELRNRGFETNEAGRWHNIANTEKMRERFSDGAA